MFDPVKKYFLQTMWILSYKWRGFHQQFWTGSIFSSMFVRAPSGHPSLACPVLFVLSYWLGHFTTGPFLSWGNVHGYLEFWFYLNWDFYKYLSSRRDARPFHELRRYHTRPLQLNWGLKNVHFGKTYFWNLNINVRIFTRPGPKFKNTEKWPKTTLPLLGTPI